MATVLPSALALEPALDEGASEASSESLSLESLPLESLESSLSFEESVELSLLDVEEPVGVVLTASSSQALRLRASRSAVGRAIRAGVFVRMR